MKLTDKQIKEIEELTGLKFHPQMSSYEQKGIIFGGKKENSCDFIRVLALWDNQTTEMFDRLTGESIPIRTDWLLPLGKILEEGKLTYKEKINYWNKNKEIADGAVLSYCGNCKEEKDIYKYIIAFGDEEECAFCYKCFMKINWSLEESKELRTEIRKRNK